jgi:hypothetical protein
LHIRKFRTDHRWIPGLRASRASRNDHRPWRFNHYAVIFGCRSPGIMISINDPSRYSAA